MARLIGFIVAAMAGFLGGYLVAQQQRPEPADPPSAAAPAPRPAPADSAPSDSAGPAEAALVGDSAALVRPGPVPRLYRTLVDSAGIDVDGDGPEERIELYADVERDGRGRITWDDGQRWALVVRDGNTAYRLLDEFVQLGTVRFMAFTGSGEGEPPSLVLVQVTTPSGDRVESFVFDRSLGGFRRTGVVQARGRAVHRSPESYD